MWKSSLFILLSAFLLNDHLSSGNLMPCVKVIEDLPGEILEFPIQIITDILQLFRYIICHLGYVTEFFEYVTGYDWCDVYAIRNASAPGSAPVSTSTSAPVSDPASTPTSDPVSTPTSDPVSTPTSAPVQSCPAPILYKKPMDCSEVMKNGENVSGLYTIWPRNDVMRNRSINVYCNMDIDGGGWTVVLNRGNFSTQENFSRNWNDYKIGFGDLQKDFWLGNDNIYAISNQKEYEIRFDIEDADGKKAFAVYSTFSIEDEAAMYKLHIGNYTEGNVLFRYKTEDRSMGSQNNMKFSTSDKDNDNSGYSCAGMCKGGWWYNNCYSVQLTGEYLPGRFSSKAIVWTSWEKNGLSAADMKLRPT